MSPRRLLPALALAGAVLVAVSAAVVNPPRGDVPASRTADVLGSTLVCPDLQNVNGDVVETRVTAGTTIAGPGRSEIAGVATSREPQRLLLDHGPGVKRYVSTTSGPVVVRTTGAITGGFVASQLGRGRLTSNRGYAETACTPPLTQQWFVGASTTVGADPYLQLVNVEDFAALVDVRVLTPTGEAQAPGGVGIVVDPRGLKRIRLDALAPDAKITAVSVTTRTGRVAAAVRDTHTFGLTELGTDWVPLVRAPQHRVMIPGIPADGDPLLSSVRLAIADPGERDATVVVHAVASDGNFVPVGLDQVTVKSGTVTILDLTKALNGKAAAVEVTSNDADIPIVAGVVVDAKAAVGPIHELMFLGAQEPLAGETFLPEIRVATDVFSTLLLSAPSDAVSLTLNFDGRPAKGRTSLEARIKVPAGRTIAVDLGQYVISAATATITPDAGSGPVYAVRYLHERGARGPLISALAAVNRQPPVEVPATRRELNVWQRGS